MVMAADNKLLTVLEADVLDDLTRVWNGFCDLPEMHPEHQQEMKTLIHQAQRLVMCRPVIREANSDRTS